MPQVISATWICRTMPGGTNSQLAVCDDGKAYVIKCCNNKQGPNVLANELIASGLMKVLGLPTPQYKSVTIPTSVAKEYSLRNPLGSVHQDCNLHFASEMVEPSSEGRLYSFLPSSFVNRIGNRRDFLGALVFDIWAGSRDPRQVVYAEDHHTRTFQAVFIDHGHLFGGPHWDFTMVHGRAFCLDRKVYASLHDPIDVERWISQIETNVPSALSALLRRVPKQWYKGDIYRLEDTLMMRMGCLRSLVSEEFANLKDPLRTSFRGLYESPPYPELLP